jgi:hypothetical protein
MTNKSHTMNPFGTRPPAHTKGGLSITHSAKTIGRRELLGRGASVAALALVGTVPLAAQASEQDVELLRLWREYLPQLEATKRATGPKEAAYEAIWAEMGPRPWDGNDAEWERGCRQLSKKLKRNTLYDAWCHEMKKIDAILKAIAATPAAGLAGMSIKAAVLEAHKEFDDEEELLEDVEKSLFADIRRSA